MKNISVSQQFTGAAMTDRFESARAVACSLAESDRGLLEPELVAWIDRTSARTSPVLEGCGGPEAWHRYGVSHEGRLEIEVNGVASFIFAESIQFDSYERFSPGPFVNVRDAQGVELICRAGSRDCVPLDEWTSKLT